MAALLVGQPSHDVRAIIGSLVANAAPLPLAAARTQPRTELIGSCVTGRT